MPITTSQDKIFASHRGSRIAEAVKTSLFSKVATIILQFIAFPLVARRLGPDMFGVFTLLSSVPLLFSTMDLGIGPALAHKLTLGVAKSDHAQQASAFRSALFLLVAISLLVLTIGAFGIFQGYYSLLFRQAIPLTSAQIRSCAWITLALVVGQLISSLGSKARTGFQELHINNLFGAAGNVVTAAALIGVIWLHPSLGSILLATYGVSVAFSLANLGLLVWQRPYLLVGEREEHLLRQMRDFVTNSLLYALAIGLLGWQREFIKFFLQLSAGPRAVGELSILLSMMNIAGGLVVMVTTPIWPAIADANARHDHAWTMALWRRINRLSLIYGLIAGAVIAVGGRTFVQLIYGGIYEIPLKDFCLLGLYFFSQVAGHIRFIWLLGFNRINRLATVTVIEFLVNFAAFILFQKSISISLALVILLGNHVLFTVLGQELYRRKNLSAA
jgi:O-antigen/teichoic acid export membrane protein